MLTVQSVLKSVVNDREYAFVCPPDSPLPDALEANAQHRAFLLGRQQLAQEAQLKQEAESKVEVIQEPEQA